MSWRKEWVIRGSSSPKQSIIDKLLEVRGIKTEEGKNEFLNPLGITLMHPNAFTQMPKAVERICKAIDEKEKILIYGDFDADGVTSTSVLMKTFGFLGADVDFYIPERETEGHGLSSKALVKLLSQKKPIQISLLKNLLPSRSRYLHSLFLLLFPVCKTKNNVSNKNNSK